MKFNPGDIIIDDDPTFGVGKIVKYTHTRDDEEYYIVIYTGVRRTSPTTNCPASEMQLYTKLHKALE